MCFETFSSAGVNGSRDSLYPWTMRNLVLLLLFSVALGGDFGEASAETISIDESSMIVAIDVEVLTSADSVVAHLASPGNETVVLPLVDRGGGVYGIQTEVRPIDYQVTFELLGPSPSLSDPVSMSSLGADFDGVTASTEPDDESAAQTRRWGWLALALTAASLAVLAIWVIVGRDDDDDETEAPAAQDDGDATTGDPADEDPAGATV